jgi:5-methylcytosine-specific restriction protein A
MIKHLRKLKKIVHGVVRERSKVHTRSVHWPAVRRDHIRRNPSCAACDGLRLLQVHHIRPFHLEPELELSPGNLITLCMGNLCHIDIGHGDDYKAYNPLVVEHAAQLRADPTAREMIVKSAKENRKYMLP